MKGVHENEKYCFPASDFIYVLKAQIAEYFLLVFVLFICFTVRRFNMTTFSPIPTSFFQRVILLRKSIISTEPLCCLLDAVRGCNSLRGPSRKFGSKFCTFSYFFYCQKFILKVWLITCQKIMSLRAREPP